MRKFKAEPEFYNKLKKIYIFIVVNTYELAKKVSDAFHQKTTD